jgi:hypothetical protein
MGEAGSRLELTRCGSKWRDLHESCLASRPSKGLYADDAGFLFETRADFELGARLLKQRLTPSRASDS